MMGSPLNKRRCDRLIKRYNQRARLALDQEMTGRGMRREIDSFVMAGLVLAIHVFHSYAVETRMPGIADKFTQSAQGRLLWPGMTTSLGRVPINRA
jgi:hypothetical protein